MTGYELKEKRELLGLSQEKLARALDVAVSSVARWEQLKKEEIPNSTMLTLALTTIEMEVLDKTRFTKIKQTKKSSKK